MRNLKIESLPDNSNWIDKDIIILHSSFQCLKDFIEQEKGLEHANYNTYKKSIDECRELYNWWIGRMNNPEPEKEDTEMLIRLINIRNFLWT